MEILQKKIRQAAFRCNAQLLLRQTGTMLALAGATALLALAVQRTLGLPPARLWMLGGLVGLALAGAVALWLARRPGRMAVALLIDQRLGLRERVSTAVSLADDRHPFSQAACAEARQHVQDMDVKAAFPVRPTGCWAWNGGFWAALLLAFFLLPELDLLGYIRRTRETEQRNNALEQALASVQAAQQKLAPIIKTLNNPDLANDLLRLADATNLPQAQDVQRQAVRKLGELADKVKELQKSPKMQSVHELRDLMRGLKGPAEGLKPELNRDLAKGEFGKAAAALRQLQKQVEQDKLSPDKQALLNAQLKDLAEQLQKLANDNQSLKEAMENAGVKPELAGLQGEQLKNELEKQGLSQEKIDELMRQAAAAQKASELARNLAEQLGQCGAATGKEQLTLELGDVAEQLELVEGDSEQLETAEMTLEEIQELLDQLGKGEKIRLQKGNGDGQIAIKGLPGGQGGNQGGGEGEGGQGQGAFSSQGGGQGQGTGARGIGYGERKTGGPEDFGTEASRAPTQKKNNKAIASWYFRGPQVTGESKIELKDAVQAGKDQAAEAINENQIPRKYEGAVKKYFGQLEEAATTQPAR